MKCKATLKIYGDVDKLYSSFIPEIKGKQKRSETKMVKKKGMIEFEIRADDAVAYRASLNSISSLLAVYEKTADMIKQ